MELSGTTNIGSVCAAPEVAAEEETKTAIEWENERCEQDEDEDVTTFNTVNNNSQVNNVNSVQSKIVPTNQPILCFDAYGNLTSRRSTASDSNVLSQQLGDLENYWDLTMSSQMLSSSEEDDGLAGTFNYTTGKIHPKKRKKPKKKIRFSDTQLKQVIKEEVQESISTSRYGRERKKRVSDGFLFGTINFNELRKVTACATTIPIARKDSKSDEEFPCLVNFEDTLIPDLGAPGNVPPEKILASFDSSSEAEDHTIKNSTKVKKSGDKIKNRNVVGKTDSCISEDERGLCTPKKSHKRKGVDSKTKGSSESADEFVTPKSHEKDSITQKGDSNISLHKKTKVVDSNEKSEFSKTLDDELFVKECADMSSHGRQTTTREERAHRRKRRGTVTSDEDLEVNFTPRKKKRKSADLQLSATRQLQDSPTACHSEDCLTMKNDSKKMKLSLDFEDMQKDKCKMECESDMMDNEIGQALSKSIDLGMVGDIADDLRLLKDLTEKSDILTCSIDNKPAENIINKISKINATEHQSSPVKKLGRGRPRKSSILSSLDPHFISSAMKLQPATNSKYIPLADLETCHSYVKEELLGDDENENTASTSLTKRGRVVRKPDLTDISTLQKQQNEARAQLREKMAMSPHLEVSNQAWTL